MTTTIRVQPMKASNGMIAEENRRLHAERDRLEAEIAKLSTGLPDGVADVVRRAEEVLAEHNSRLAALIQAKDALDAKFGVSAREDAEARERARAEHHDRLADTLRTAEASRVEAAERVEMHARGLCQALTDAFAAGAAVRSAVGELMTFAGVKRYSTHLAEADFAQRMGGRISGVMRMLPRLYRSRLGPIAWGEAGSFRAEDHAWAEDERGRWVADIEAAIATPVRENADEQ